MNYVASSGGLGIFSKVGWHSTLKYTYFIGHIGAESRNENLGLIL